jgi:hypothetical protein
MHHILLEGVIVYEGEDFGEEFKDGSFVCEYKVGAWFACKCQYKVEGQADTPSP